MGRRKNYPWDSRVDKQMTNLVSGLLAGLIVAPFAIMDSVPNNTSSLNTEPVSKPVAIIYLIIGIAVTPLFITLISLAIELFDLFLIGPLLCFALIFIPLVAWGGIIYTVIESFSNNKKTNNKPKGAINDYQKLVLSLSKESKIDSNIRPDCDSIIKSNIEIKEKIEKLNNTIDTYKRKLKIFGSIPKVKKSYFSKIMATYREIHSLKTFNKVSISTEEINGYVYLDINTIISAGKLINLDKLARNKKKPHLFYAINKDPLISLHFRKIELYFFDDVVAFMTEDAYTIIDKNTVFLEYHTIPVECSMANKDVTQFNILDTKCRHFCKDGSMDMRYYHYRLIELGELELNIASQKVNLLFSNTESGSNLYQYLIYHLDYPKKTRICRYSY